MTSAWPASDLILPGTGRGTSRRLVEGAHCGGIAQRKAPSVIPPERHLPVPGRIEIRPSAIRRSSPQPYSGFA
jgi:hypothetical protein